MSHKDKASYDSMPPFTYSCMADPWQNLMFLSPPATLTDFWEVCLRNVVPKRCDLIVSRNVIQLQGSWKRSKCWLSKKLFLIALPPKCRVRGTSRRADYREMSTAGFVEAVKNGLVLKTICAGDFVGEIAFLASCKHAFGLGQVCLAERTRVCDVVAGADGTECWEVCVCVCMCVCMRVCVCVCGRAWIPMHSIGSRARNDTYIRRYLL